MKIYSFFLILFSISLSSYSQVLMVQSTQHRQIVYDKKGRYENAADWVDANEKVILDIPKQKVIILKGGDTYEKFDFKQIFDTWRDDFGRQCTDYGIVDAFGINTIMRVCLNKETKECDVYLDTKSTTWEYRGKRIPY